MITFFSDPFDMPNSDDYALSFSCDYEINFTYNSNARIKHLKELDVNTKEFSIIALRFLNPGLFNGDFDTPLIQKFGNDIFEKIKQNKNIWLIIFDIYDETKCLTEKLPTIVVEDKRNSLSDRTILFNSSRNKNNPHNLFKFKYTIPYWIKHFHEEIKKGIWNFNSIVNEHKLESKSKLFLCLMNNARMSRNIFYRMIQNNNNIKDKIIMSFVAEGIRLNNDVSDVRTMDTDRYQDSSWYSATLFSVVFETSWNNDFFTEKIFKPILNEHPILALQNKSYFEYLNDLGINLMHEPFTNRNYQPTALTETSVCQEMVKDLYNEILKLNSMSHEQVYYSLYDDELIQIRKQNKKRLLDKKYCIGQMNRYVEQATLDIKTTYSMLKFKQATIDIKKNHYNG